MKVIDDEVEMKNRCYWTSCLLFIALVLLSNGASGQSAVDNKTRNFTVEFRPGENQAVRDGKADYDVSYIYSFKARKGQLITVEVDSAEKELTFALSGDKHEDWGLANKAIKWSGRGLQSVEYKVELVMNNKNAKNVPYHLRVTIEGD